MLRLYILDNGWLECDANWMVAMSVCGTLENKTPRIKWIKIPVYTVLLDHPSGKILYDTGCHPDAMTGYWPPGLKSIFPYYHNDNQLLLKQLHLTGTVPEEIRTVILSHLHLDHAGNAHLFKHANFYVHRKDELNRMAHALSYVPTLDQGCQLFRAAQCLSIDKDA